MNPNKISIAVVDDDASFSCAIERRLRASGFDVRTFASAEAFLAPAPLPQPDCLVLDIHLGGMSGLVLQRELRQQGATTPVIFVTAHDAPGIRQEAEHDGCSAYFLKPVPGQLLVDAIMKAVQPGPAASPASATTSPDAAPSTDPTQPPIPETMPQ